MGLYLLYILTIIIGLYALYVNIPALIEIGIPKNEIQFGKFMASFFPVVVGLFMIYFGSTSLYSLIKGRGKSS